MKPAKEKQTQAVCRSLCMQVLVCAAGLEEKILFFFQMERSKQTFSLLISWSLLCKVMKKKRKLVACGNARPKRVRLRGFIHAQSS